MDKKKILIIHLSRLGDMVQSLPAIKLLKEDNPEIRITYLGIEKFCDILTDVPWIDNLVTLPWQEISTIMREFNKAGIDALDRLRETIPELNEEYDMAINFTHNWSSSYLSEKVKAREKRGRIFSQNNEIAVPGKWGKYLFGMAKNQKDNLLNLVDMYMGLAGIKNRPTMQFLPTNPEMDQKCASQLSDLGFKIGKLSIGFQLAAGEANRIWRLENFVKLGEHLTEHSDAQIILFGSERDIALADQFQTSATYPFINLIGQTTLKELASYLKGIDVLVSSDTGPMHIAAAVGTKVVGIFVGTAYFGVTAAYGAGHVAVQSNYPCAPCLSTTACSDPLCRESIKPDTVAQAVRLALGLEVELSYLDSEATLYKSAFNPDGTLRYQLITQNTDGFLPWLRLSHYLKAMVSQTLWNNWLGLNSDNIDPALGKINGQRKAILADFQQACSAYKDLYEDGRGLCQKIINEFQKETPNLQLIQVMVESLRQIEERVKDLEGPLAILKDVHEFYMAETEICEFPKLAHQFLDKFTALKDIITSFETTLQEIEVSLD